MNSSNGNRISKTFKRGFSGYVRLLEKRNKAFRESFEYKQAKQQELQRKRNCHTKKQLTVFFGLCLSGFFLVLMGVWLWNRFPGKGIICIPMIVIGALEIFSALGFDFVMTRINEGTRKAIGSLVFSATVGFFVFLFLNLFVFK
ncbi:MAG: hypothetical protein PHP64_00220 [Actinomycetota bacterium]|nr:hypothetical protein [Actinomycetota bacterium]